MIHPIRSQSQRKKTVEAYRIRPEVNDKAIQLAGIFGRTGAGAYRIRPPRRQKRIHSTSLDTI